MRFLLFAVLCLQLVSCAPAPPQGQQERTAKDIVIEEMTNTIKLVKMPNGDECYVFSWNNGSGISCRFTEQGRKP